MTPIIQMTHFTSDDIEQAANKKPVMHLSKSDIKQSRKQMIILFIIFASFLTIFSIYDCKQMITQINSLKEINTNHEEKINSFDVSITSIKNEVNDLFKQKDNLDRELISEHALKIQSENSYNDENQEVVKLSKEIAKLHVEVDGIRRKNKQLTDKANMLLPNPMNKWKFGMDNTIEDILNQLKFKHDFGYDNINMPSWLRNRFMRPY